MMVEYPEKIEEFRNSDELLTSVEENHEKKFVNNKKTGKKTDTKKTKDTKKVGVKSAKKKTPANKD
jgi:chromosome condensin MukBEF MukE localization factor